jgi:ketosteroid isomerase-like protein
MMTERDEQNIEVVRRFYAAEQERAAPDIVWHVPGHNPVSGVYSGRNEYFEMMPSRMAPLDRWEIDVLDVMVNGDLVVAGFRLRGERRGRSVELDGVHLFRINAEGQVAEGWGFTSDQDALDEFFSA